MLNTFPSLLFLSFFAPMILRLALGLTLVWFAYEHFIKKGSPTLCIFDLLDVSKSRFVYLLHALLYFISGIFITIGLYTQIFAILATLLLFVSLLGKFMGKEMSYGKIVYFLLIVISLSLIISGAGAFAFDLPM